MKKIYFLSLMTSVALSANAYTLLPKPGLLNTAGEMGRTVAQHRNFSLLGAQQHGTYTSYNVEKDEYDNEKYIKVGNAYQGAIHLFEDTNNDGFENQHREVLKRENVITYQFIGTPAFGSDYKPNTGDYRGLHLGAQLAMSDKWIAAMTTDKRIFIVGKDGNNNWETCPEVTKVINVPVFERINDEIKEVGTKTDYVPMIDCDGATGNFHWIDLNDTNLDPDLFSILETYNTTIEISNNLLVISNPSTNSVIEYEYNDALQQWGFKNSEKHNDSIGLYAVTIDPVFDSKFATSFSLTLGQNAGLIIAPEYVDNFTPSIVLINEGLIVIGSSFGTSYNIPHDIDLTTFNNISDFGHTIDVYNKTMVVGAGSLDGEEGSVFIFNFNDEGTWVLTNYFSYDSPVLYVKMIDGKLVVSLVRKTEKVEDEEDEECITYKDIGKFAGYAYLTYGITGYANNGELQGDTNLPIWELLGGFEKSEVTNNIEFDGYYYIDRIIPSCSASRLSFVGTQATNGFDISASNILTGWVGLPQRRDNDEFVKLVGTGVVTKFTDSYKSDVNGVPTAVGPFINPLVVDDAEGAMVWKNTGDFNWTKNSGTTPSFNTGPSSGTDGSTNYYYVETSAGHANTSGDTAVLESGVYNVSNETTLEFDYHMNGSNVGSLAVYIFVNGGWAGNSWSDYGLSPSDEWKKSGVIKMTNSGDATSKFKFKIVYRAAGGYLGDVAIDNIRVSNK